MPSNIAQTIPEILTDKNWQKQKGLIAKAHGETGIGELMKKLATAFNDVDWQAFNVMETTNATTRTLDNLARLKTLAKAQFPKLNNYHDAALVLYRQANKIAAEWKNSKTIPSSSRKHVENIATNAINLATAIKSFKWDQDFNDLYAQLARAEQVATNMLSGYIKGVKNALVIVNKDPTFECYQKHMHQQVRGLGTNIRSIASLKSTDWGKRIVELSSDGFARDADTPEKIKALLVKIAKFIKEFEAR